MITAVVFDMDGVLFDTERLCRLCWLKLAEEDGIPNMPEVYALCIGVNAETTERIVYENYGKDFPYKEYCKRTSAMYNQCIEENGVPVKDGVRETLEKLAAAGVKIAVASSTRREKVLRHLESAGIDRYFSAVVGGDTVTHSKPASRSEASSDFRKSPFSSINVSMSVNDKSFSCRTFFSFTIISLVFVICSPYKTWFSCLELLFACC